MISQHDDIIALLHSAYMLRMYTAYFNDIVVGGVCCRVETEAMVKKLYIMTLGCLAAYRRLGVGMYGNDPCVDYPLVSAKGCCTCLYWQLKYHIV